MNRLPSLLQRAQASSVSSKLANGHVTAPATAAAASLASFRDVCFAAERPCFFPAAEASSAHLSNSDRMPASHRWFSPKDGAAKLNTTYLRTFDDTAVPIEMVRRNANGSSSFARFETHLSAFLDYIELRQKRSHAATETEDGALDGLYLAQCSISSLAKAMQDDLPTPPLVLEAGRGDVYDSSIWMGLPPTFTPLHKDPNPNLFMQLAGAKVIRMFAPALGLELFNLAQRHVRGSASASMRGAEMMQGAERKVLEVLVWDDEKRPRTSADGLEFEVEVAAGDAVFIPKGWWHSVRGTGSGICASVNWWFR